MKQVSALPFRVLAALAVCLVSSGVAGAQTTHPLYNCANTVLKALRSYQVDYFHATARCEVDVLQGTATDCSTDKQLEALIQNYNDDLYACDWKCPDGPMVGQTCDPFDSASCGKGKACASVSGSCSGHIALDTTAPITACTTDTERALCPLESRNDDVLFKNIAGDAAGDVAGGLQTLAADLFVTSYPGCTRPTAPVSTSAANCATSIANLAEQKGDELSQCFFSCERANLGVSDACVDPDTGDPANDDVSACIANKTDDLTALTNDCQDADLTAIGCPLGTSKVVDLITALALRLTNRAQDLSFSTFHASCRTSLPGTTPPLVPAQVRLDPSGTLKQVSCGQTLDSTFFGKDKTLTFTTDLDCGPSQQSTNGVVVAKSNVVLRGDSQKRSISGPGSRSLRLGVGVLVAPGAKHVTVASFKQIRNFSVGVQDSGTYDASTGAAVTPGDNRALRISATTFFRNLQAGVRSSSIKTKVISATGDRNGIAFDLSGDSSLIRLSTARRSEPQQATKALPLSPGTGIRLAGIDTNGNGQTILLTKSEMTQNVVGLALSGEKHSIVQNKVDTNSSDGVQVAGTGHVLDSNSIKMNVGNGVVVSGDTNSVRSNHSDENSGAGYLISGTANVIENNGAGSPPSRGNSQQGYMITGADNRFDSNRAEANLGNGFTLEAVTDLFKGNRAEGNSAMGFDVESAGNSLEANSAQTNTSDEYQIVPGNTDAGGNKANGSGVSFSSIGATIN